MKPAIKIENLSKQYRLGSVGTGSFAHDMNRWWHTVRGKADPYLKIGESNDRTKKGNSDYVWALQNINFEVQPGEVLGIIGKNGAGKSTLLKLLSRVTAPTTGSIKARGRIASLLEVGTGFHPELTGRENVFLNGAIMGMTKKEIASKFDEIVDFAGCERYIDTPVKRYSSGMYVRLAFAVAAHLEPEILIVDEVLAVGDAEFQKKAIGKMKEVSKGGGRTVLFVSHNMASIQQLCSRCVILENGTKIFEGDVNKAITRYLQNSKLDAQLKLVDRKDRTGTGNLKFSDFRVIREKTNESIDCIISGDDVIFQFELIGGSVNNVNFRMQVFDSSNHLKFLCNNLHSASAFKYVKGTNKVQCKIASFPLLTGDYYVNLRCRAENEIQDDIEFAFEFKVENGDFFGTGNIPAIHDGILINHKWEII
ncbi:ABC transporter ATP-binding protein [Tamlana sp. 2_MG-2023]|uniref:ABC transporter ATP-binding protein n=1 Tax=unclassified Tamlana TaxID=2614803 RepID=UPI0026E324C9|nr:MULTISPECIES: ABC transporter ATP-binding protein [unclassified Tamlana]MDO6760236.1 ABC transporter ATP-binding protein [Tamlana sp. 2_MG-2023]MDO6790066.1 ABC transporter ATP-binding protein [Tamlana sp. 1_MG-2023]